MKTICAVLVVLVCLFAGAILADETETKTDEVNERNVFPSAGKPLLVDEGKLEGVPVPVEENANIQLDEEVMACSSTADCLTEENACVFAKCIKGICQFKAMDCSDRDACTIDSCDPQVGCTYTAVKGCVGEPTADNSHKHGHCLWNHHKDDSEDGSKVNFCSYKSELNDDEMQHLLKEFGTSVDMAEDGDLENKGFQNDIFKKVGMMDGSSEKRVFMDDSSFQEEFMGYHNANQNHNGTCTPSKKQEVIYWYNNNLNINNNNNCKIYIWLKN